MARIRCDIPSEAPHEAMTTAITSPTVEISRETVTQVATCATSTPMVSHGNAKVISSMKVSTVSGSTKMATAKTNMATSGTRLTIAQNDTAAAYTVIAWSK